MSRLAALAIVLLTASAGAADDGGARDEPEPVPKPATPSPTEAPTPEWGVSGPYAIDLHFRLGAGARLDAPPAYEMVSPGGVLGGVGLGLALSKRIALGLAYEYLDMGRERSGVLTSGVVNISRDLHVGWLDLKLYPIRSEPIGMYLSLAAGLSVQEAELTASLWLPETPGDSVSFFCGASGDPGFSFQGALGVDAVVATGLRMFVDAGIANHRLTDEVIGGCAPGAGTATVLAMRSGLGYAWDL